MKKRIRRRIAGAGAVLAAGSGFLFINDAIRISLADAAVFSGWVLAGVMLVLASYNLRKRFPIPPLLSSSLWLQVHIYAGWFTFIVFAAHGSLTWPSGALDRMLWILYWAVALSGVIGLIISRLIPPRLTSRGREAIFERIPEIRRDLRERAEALVEQSIGDTGAMTISSFYTARLRDFFGGPRNLRRHITSLTSALSRQMTEIEDQYRYLNDQERETMQQLAELVRTKDSLDHQHALQMLLKLWLFVHVPLTYCLLAAVALHVVLVYAFNGSPG